MSKDSMSWEQAVLWLRAQPDMQEVVKQNYYDDPLPAAAVRFMESSEWQAVRRLLSGRTGSALEIGAGRGIASYAFARDGWQVTALEPDPSDVVGAGAVRRLAKSAEACIEVVEQWGESLPFTDASFDLVYCRAVLHHARDLEALGREIERVLRPGGLVVACREHVVTDEKELADFLDSHPLHRLYGGEHAYLLGEYVSALSVGNVKITQVLNPFASDINIYPQAREDVRKVIAGRLNIPSFFVRDWMMRIVGDLIRSPGRLYTFVGEKRHG